MEPSTDTCTANTTYQKIQNKSVYNTKLGKCNKSTGYENTQGSLEQNNPNLKRNTSVTSDDYTCLQTEEEREDVMGNSDLSIIPRNTFTDLKGFEYLANKEKRHPLSTRAGLQSSTDISEKVVPTNIRCRKSSPDSIQNDVEEIYEPIGDEFPTVIRTNFQSVFSDKIQNGRTSTPVENLQNGLLMLNAMNDCGKSFQKCAEYQSNAAYRDRRIQTSNLKGSNPSTSCTVNGTKTIDSSVPFDIWEKRDVTKDYELALRKQKVHKSAANDSKIKTVSKTKIVPATLKEIEKEQQKADYNSNEIYGDSNVGMEQVQIIHTNSRLRHKKQMVDIGTMTDNQQLDTANNPVKITNKLTEIDCERYSVRNIKKSLQTNEKSKKTNSELPFNFTVYAEKVPNMKISQKIVPNEDKTKYLDRKYQNACSTPESGMHSHAGEDQSEVIYSKVNKNHRINRNFMTNEHTRSTPLTNSKTGMGITHEKHRQENKIQSIKEIDLAKSKNVKNETHGLDRLDVLSAGIQNKIFDNISHSKSNKCSKEIQTFENYDDQSDHNHNNNTCFYSELSLSKPVLVCSFDVITANDTQGPWITGSAIGPQDQLIFVDHANGSIKIFDEEGSLLCEFGNGILIKPYNVALTPSGKIAVIDKKSPEIKFFSLKGRLCRYWEGEFQDPCGIDCDKNGNVFVTDLRSRSIQMYTPKGTLLNLISMHKGKALFRFPYDIHALNNNLIILTDNWAHNLKIFNYVGELAAVYGKRGTENGQLLYPTEVCTDAHGNILVADHGNSRVHLLSPVGTFIRFLLTSEDGLHNPDTLALTNRGHFIITQDRTVVKIFKYRNQ